MSLGTLRRRLARIEESIPDREAVRRTLGAMMAAAAMMLKTVPSGPEDGGRDATEKDADAEIKPR